MTQYQEMKSMLRAHAEYVKVQYRGDKPMINQSINDYKDDLCKDYKASEYQVDLLSNYTCKLHAKD